VIFDIWCQLFFMMSVASRNNRRSGYEEGRGVPSCANATSRKEQAGLAIMLKLTPIAIVVGLVGGYLLWSGDTQLVGLKYQLLSYGRLATLQLSSLYEEFQNSPNQTGQTSDLTASDHRQDVPQTSISDHAIAIRHEKSKVEPGESTNNNLLETSFSAFEPVRQNHVLVHLASFRTANAARREWEELKSRYPAQLVDLNLRIARVDLGTQGIFYRVLADLAQDRSGASRLCNSLRTVNQYCSVVEFEAVSVL